MTFWTQAFLERNPLITIDIADPGGIAGIDALINATTDVALVSIPISQKQREAFEARFGYRPYLIPVAKDAVAVYVNNVNPISSINLQDLDAIFSSNHRCGESQVIGNWGDLGVKGVLALQKITVFGLTVDTGATDLFRKVALCGGDFIKEFQAMPGPESIQSAIVSEPAGLGFSTNAMKIAGIHRLSIIESKKVVAIAPTPEAVRSGLYPFSRSLSFAINRPVNQTISPALQSFVDFVLSAEGQDIAIKAGYIALH